MKRWPSPLIAIAFFLSGCISSSGVLQLGPDTYTISAGTAGTGSISGNDTGAKRKALTEANSFCAKKGKQILVQNTGMKSTVYGSTNDIVFQCLDASDPALKIRPEYQKEPDIKIENKN